MNKILKNLFRRYNEELDMKSYDLGKLQRNNYIKYIPDMSNCPNCNSRNITWKFFIPTDGSKPTKDSLSICNDCSYTDKKGEFEKTNKSILREKKIDSLLNGVQ